MVGRGGWLWGLGIFFIVLCSFSRAWGTETDAAAESQRSQREMGSAAEMYRVVQEFNRHLDLLRRHMGVPRPDALGIKVSKVARYDVYFQALTLFQKANLLSFEITRLKMEAPPMPAGAISDADVSGLIVGAHQAVHTVMAELHVDGTEEVDLPLEAGKTCSDVFESILAANRQLNLLLDHRITPSDSFQKVTLAIGYAAQLLGRFADGPRIPEAPPFEAEKRPAEVYSRLLRCLAMIAGIFQTAGFEMLLVDSSGIDEKIITPGDVFDLASLIVAQLDFLHRHFAVPGQPRQSFYPGRKYPSDVFQQAGILEQQLQKLKESGVRSQGAGA